MMLKKNIIKKFFTPRKEIEKKAGLREFITYDMVKGRVGDEKMDKILHEIYRICSEILSCKNK